jgi:hypothetical protein
MWLLIIIAVGTGDITTIPFHGEILCVKAETQFLKLSGVYSTTCVQQGDAL